jgi:hypothetical protein
LLKKQTPGSYLHRGLAAALVAELPIPEKSLFLATFGFGHFDLAAFSSLL